MDSAALFIDSRVHSQHLMRKNFLDRWWQDIFNDEIALSVDKKL